jgi:hypothetical protein
MSVLAAPARKLPLSCPDCTGGAAKAKTMTKTPKTEPIRLNEQLNASLMASLLEKDRFFGNTARPGASNFPTESHYTFEFPVRKGLYSRLKPNQDFWTRRLRSLNDAAA